MPQCKPRCKAKQQPRTHPGTRAGKSGQTGRHKATNKDKQSRAKGKLISRGGGGHAAPCSKSQRGGAGGPAAARRSAANSYGGGSPRRHADLLQAKRQLHTLAHAAARQSARRRKGAGCQAGVRCRICCKGQGWRGRGGCGRSRKGRGRGKSRRGRGRSRGTGHSCKGEVCWRHKGSGWHCCCCWGHGGNRCRCKRHRGCHRRCWRHKGCRRRRGPTHRGGGCRRGRRRASWRRRVEGMAGECGGEAQAASSERDAAGHPVASWGARKHCCVAIGCHTAKEGPAHPQDAWVGCKQGRDEGGRGDLGGHAGDGGMLLSWAVTAHKGGWQGAARPRLRQHDAGLPQKSCCHCVRSEGCDAGRAGAPRRGEEGGPDNKEEAAGAGGGGGALLQQTRCCLRQQPQSCCWLHAVRNRGAQDDVGARRGLREGDRGRLGRRRTAPSSHAASGT